MAVIKGMKSQKIPGQGEMIKMIEESVSTIQELIKE